LGHGPQTGDEFPGDGHHDLMGVCPPCAQLSVAWTAPDLGLPAEVLDEVGWLCEAPWQMSAPLGGVAIGPSPRDKSPSGRGVAGCGEGPRPALRSGGSFRGHQAHAFPQGSRVIDTRAIAHGCYPGDRPGAWHTAPDLPRLDRRVHPPGVHVIWSCRCETLEAFGVLRHRMDLCLEDALLSRGGTAHRRAPSQGGRAPSGPASRTDSRSQHNGVTTALGGFAIAAGLCTRPGEIAHGGSFDLGDIDGGEIT
jgi:hypothetical protein